MEGELRNEGRAERARMALDTYNRAGHEEDTLEDDVVDLITDLLHMVHLENPDRVDECSALLAIAQTHFEAEVEEEEAGL